MHGFLAVHAVNVAPGIIIRVRNLSDLLHLMHSELTLGNNVRDRAPGCHIHGQAMTQVRLATIFRKLLHIHLICCYLLLLAVAAKHTTFGDSDVHMTRNTNPTAGATNVLTQRNWNGISDSKAQLLHAPGAVGFPSTLRDFPLIDEDIVRIERFEHLVAVPQNRTFEVLDSFRLHQRYRKLIHRYSFDLLSLRKELLGI